MPVEILDNGVSAPAVTAVLMHGIGLGPWFWEPWFSLFAERGVLALALRMPGHGDGRENVSFQETLAACREVVGDIPGPVALVGHSMGGLVAQKLAEEREFHAIALTCPLPPGQVPVLPSRLALLGVPALLPALLTGRPLTIPWRDYRRLGLVRLTEADARAAYAKIVAWPNRLARDLLRPPHVDVERVSSPVLVALGMQDILVPWQRARLLGDLYEGVVWRYDDLGHNPPIEPGGGRMGRDVAGFVAEPFRPRVLESEGFTPEEGVGHQTRRKRRGEEMKKRSAYGQKESAR